MKNMAEQNLKIKLERKYYKQIISENKTYFYHMYPIDYQNRTRLIESRSTADIGFLFDFCVFSLLTRL